MPEWCWKVGLQGIMLDRLEHIPIQLTFLILIAAFDRVAMKFAPDYGYS
jgi:hypothetical protein